MIKLAYSLSLVCWLLNCNSIKCTNRPIVGVLVQEFTNETFIEHQTANTGFITSTYVKAIESSGARVVPVFNRRNLFYYEWIMNSINGIVLPGGHAPTTPGHPYYDAAKKIFKIAEKLYDEGKPFPVFGVCLGFQAMMVAYNDDVDLLKRCNSYENNPLEFQSNYTESLLFSGVDQDTLFNLESFPVTCNSHTYCVLPSTFEESRLPQNWRITSLSTTSKGEKFIASVEHVKYPFVGVQFHPEIVAYNWAQFEHLSVPHDQRTIRSNRFFYDVLVGISMSNENKFKNLEDEMKTLIYNYNPIYRYDKTYNYFAQKYVFYE